ncbi:hypothetical protein LTR56_018383 [Elasticomyces elasticus]|nr:hypothetical protein LTR56_018383 [Elasticomyces elasticus]KAK3637271.1 hypothetical protein LTR22_018305 [Elasticomyces elasticus]KAK4916456.1 hypothetical protein LTR49_015554 [Elasticomyces elasticus]KAK5755997.1 hypothetical protein LTS12_013886 [Elasticomyces elasticus]
MKLLAVTILVTSVASVQVFPRQTSVPFGNGSSSATLITGATGSMTTSPPATTPPPCCWVIAGSLAVGIGRWWSSSAVETVATVVTNYMRNNYTTILLNSSTIYRPANETFAARSYSFYFAAEFVNSALTSPIAIPTNLLTGSGAHLNNLGPDYAGTSIISGTVETFDHTDLKITSPTAFDKWFNLGILTVYPDLSTTPPDMLSYEPTMCGSWTTPRHVFYSTDKTDFSTTTYTQSGTTKTYTGTDYDYTAKSTSTGIPSLRPYWWHDSDFFRVPLWLDGQHNLFDPTSSAPGIASPSAWGAIALNATYIQPVATQMPDGAAYVNFPPGLMPWLAQQPNISSRFPFIESCWTIWGEGQPTVHVPVVQLTASSTNYVEMAGASATSPELLSQFPSTGPVALVPQTSIMSPTAPAAPPSSIGALGSSSSAPGSSNTIRTQEDQGQTSPTAQAQTQTTDESTSPSPVKTSATNSLGGLLSAISSVGQQQQQQASSADVGGSGDEHVSPIQTGGPGARTSNAMPGTSTLASTPGNADSSQPAYAVGSQIASPGGPAISSEGTTYSALPSGSGLQVAGSDGTSTVLALATDSPLPYVANGQTISSSIATISGTTYSVLPSGSGVRVVAADTTAIIQPSYPTIPAVTTLPNGQLISSIGISSVSTPASITIDSQVLRYSSIAPGQYAIGSETLAAGGSAIVEHGQTLSLATQSGSAALIINGASTVTLPANVPASATQLVTIGDQTYTAYATASSALVIDGVTVHPGSVTLIKGETVRLSGTNLLVASETATSTEGLGAAIISGLGGSPSSTTGSPETFTGTATSERKTMFLSNVLVLVAMCLYLA